MAVKKILVCYDSSECANNALHMACEIALMDPEIHLDVITVAPIPHLAQKQAEELADVIALIEEDGRQILSKAYDEIDPDLVDRTDVLLLSGPKPADEILKLTNQEDCDYDMLVLGSRGLTGMKEYLGSVSHKILNGCKIPVLVAR